MITTNNFASMGAAITHFKEKDIPWNEVMDMVDEGSVIIGPPVIEAGVYLSCEKGRYSIHSETS